MLAHRCYFLHDDSIRAPGHHRSCHDARRLPAADRFRRRGTGGERLNNREDGRFCFGRVFHIGGADSKPVHRRIVKRRDVFASIACFSEDIAVAVKDVAFFCR